VEYSDMVKLNANANDKNIAMVFFLDINNPPKKEILLFLPCNPLGFHLTYIK